MKKLLLVFSMLSMLLLSSCVVKDIISEIDNTDDVQVINSTESNLSLEFPDSWKSYDLHEEASIQMAHLLKEQYIVVLEESADDFTDEFTLDEYTSIVMESMIENSDMEVISNSEIHDSKIGNNINAKQFEMSASVDKIKITYLVTCVMDDGVFYQFTAWSLPSKYDEAKPVFEKILDSASFYNDSSENNTL